MAEVKINDLIKFLKGSIGNITFRTFNGKTFMYGAVRTQDKRKETALQRATRTRFQQRARLTKSMLLDPACKAHYTAEAKRLLLPNAYIALLKELMVQKSDNITTDLSYKKDKA